MIVTFVTSLGEGYTTSITEKAREQMDNQAAQRLAAKTPEQRYLTVLEQDFGQPPPVAQVFLEEAQSCLLGQAEWLRPGQMRVILAQLDAGYGQALRQTATTEVTWTVDAGQEDRRVLQTHGLVALRRVRIQRLLDEALAQDAAATQEDLAQVLQVSVRTIKRDCRALEEQGIYLPTRGKLKGVGRGQTHKAQIVGCWLRGETYDQIALHTHHCLSSIQRYVRAFVRVVDLHQQGFADSDIALVLEMSVPLVQEYLAVYAQHDAPEYRARLTEQIERLGQAPRLKKGAP
jgi:DNA-binding Lrp family transcriptional regulator